MISKICRLALGLLFWAGALQAATPWQEHGALRVSENGRSIVHRDGTAFFYFGDTAWELFHRLNREDAELYLRRRAEQGFTVIQAVALAEFDGLTAPNAYGHLPLVENDPTRPAVTEGPANDYWDQVDFVVQKAAELGLVVGFLPTWGDKWNKEWGKGPEVFTMENAAIYGEWLGRRYREAPIIWILGGDRPVETEAQKEIIRAMAAGLRKGDCGAHLISFHPSGGRGSSEVFHNEPWLDFNMRQNGHQAEWTGRYEKTRADHDLTPAKPVLDAEPLYEDHPLSFKAKEFGHSVAADVRRAFYWDMFSGACGHTFGNHAIWQFWTPERTPVNSPLLPWQEALKQPGAPQIAIGMRLLKSRPSREWVPDDRVIVPAAVPTEVPGTGTRRFAAMRDTDGAWAMVYVPVGRPFRVNLDVLTGQEVTAWWFDPRNAESRIAQVFRQKGEAEFQPPAAGELLDYVLVLDDASKGFGAPGR